MSDADVLAANDRFYAAFAERDFAAMDAVWETDTAVVCIHPGWPPIRGRKEILASWRSIFDNDESPPIRCEAPTVQRHADAATVVCRERLGGTVLVATNVFVHGADGWRMVHHHASALARVPDTPPLDPDLLPN
jgi:ketosteroid isomerase-like protein